VKRLLLTLGLSIFLCMSTQENDCKKYDKVWIVGDYILTKSEEGYQATYKGRISNYYENRAFLAIEELMYSKL